jgi:hypothetical protein
MRYLSVVLLLVACASPSDPFVPAGDCPTSTVGAVLTEAAADCAAVEHRLQLAVRVLGDYGIPVDASGVTVWVTDRAAPLEHGFGGYYINDRAGVVLTRTMESAAHELIHHYRYTVLHVSSVTEYHHVGWGTPEQDAVSDYRWNRALLYP